MTYEWSPDDIRMNPGWRTNEFRMTYEWSPDDIRMKSDDIRMKPGWHMNEADDIRMKPGWHTSEARMTYKWSPILSPTRTQATIWSPRHLTWAWPGFVSSKPFSSSLSFLLLFFVPFRHYFTRRNHYPWLWLAPVLPLPSSTRYHPLPLPSPWSAPQAAHAW